MTQLQNVISRIELMMLEGFSLPRREEGQTLVEYALILVLIAVVVVAVVATLGGTIKSVFTNVSSSI